MTTMDRLTLLEAVLAAARRYLRAETGVGMVEGLVNLKEAVAACPELPAAPVPECPCCTEGGEA